MKDPICKDTRQQGCFGRTRLSPNRCRILNETYPDGECPFFKTDKEFNDGLEKWGDGKDYIRTHAHAEEDMIDG